MVAVWGFLSFLKNPARSPSRPHPNGRVLLHFQLASARQQRHVGIAQRARQPADLRAVHDGSGSLVNLVQATSNQRLYATQWAGQSPAANHPAAAHALTMCMPHASSPAAKRSKTQNKQAVPTAT